MPESTQWTLLRDLLSFLVDLVPIEVSAASVDVDLFRAQPSGPLPEISAKPEDQNNRERKIAFEKTFYSLRRSERWVFWRRNRGHCDVELGYCQYKQLQQTDRLTWPMRTRTMIARPSHEPATPPTALKGISSRVWPWCFHALRNRI
jgi:hypothetical protein